MRMVMDFEKNVFRAPMKKLDDISALSRELLIRASANKCWVSVKSLASLASKGPFLHLAVPVAKMYLWELHYIVKFAASWSGLVRF